LGGAADKRYSLDFIRHVRPVMVVQWVILIGFGALLLGLALLN
jgi:hypothetical protein